MRRCAFAGLLLMLAVGACADGGLDETLDTDDRVFIAPELTYSGRGGDSTRLFRDRGAGARFVLVMMGDRSPGDADIVLDLALAGGGGDWMESFAVGARWIPRVRPHHRPLLRPRLRKLRRRSRRIPRRRRSRRSSCTRRPTPLWRRP